MKQSGVSFRSPGPAFLVFGKSGDPGQKIKSPVFHGRAPVVSSPDRAGKGEEGIHNSVVLSRHPSEDPFEGFEAPSEGDEFQAVFLPPGPGHGAAKNEGFRIVAFLGASPDVGGGGGFWKLFVRHPLPPHDLVLS